MAISNREILLMADVVSREKDLDREVIFAAIEAALSTATRKFHKDEMNASVIIDRETGDYETFRVWEVVEDDFEEFDEELHIKLSEAKKTDASLELGDLIQEAIGQAEFGRIQAQAAKQVIMQRVREASREQIIERFKDREGEMVSGTVKRMERGDVIVDLGDAEAVLQRRSQIPTDGLRTGDRVRALLQEVRATNRGPQLFLDRVSPQFLIELFKIEVPEVGEGMIEIHGAARDPGIRAKISVQAKDKRIDPVGACVGIRGSRVQSVSNEIAGERVDIIVWSDQIAEFALKALAPAEIESLLIDEDKRSIDVVVSEENQSRAIGRGGQNVRLASELVGWELNILTDEEAEQKQAEEISQLVERFQDTLGIDEEVATVLANEGFNTVEEVAYTDQQELVAIEEFSEEMVDELQRRAQDIMLTRAIAEQAALVPEDDLLNMDGMNEEMAKALASKGVRSMEDLAECATDELMELIEIEESEAQSLIMTARAPWFE
ncbi:MAG: transcription termination/antitermination protein NusA [Proteobacteria bacterium]|nr:transcription termination/antitermination protein NusA [Pseudomonadota bacterium]